MLGFSHILTHLRSPLAVFDDGDERTLKRSSLCLKGGRHFDKSESLDNLPLTDPENFGTPVLHSAKKPSRKRRRGSQSPSRKEEESVNGKRHCSYPEKFPVGKVRKIKSEMCGSRVCKGIRLCDCFVKKASKLNNYLEKFPMGTG